jgi:hypothetical protein
MVKPGKLRRIAVQQADLIHVDRVAVKRAKLPCHPPPLVEKPQEHAAPQALQHDLRFLLVSFPAMRGANRGQVVVLPEGLQPSFVLGKLDRKEGIHQPGLATQVLGERLTIAFDRAGQSHRQLHEPGHPQALLSIAGSTRRFDSMAIPCSRANLSAVASSGPKRGRVFSRRSWQAR